MTEHSKEILNLTQNLNVNEGILKNNGHDNDSEEQKINVGKNKLDWNWKRRKKPKKPRKERRLVS